MWTIEELWPQQRLYLVESLPAPPLHNRKHTRTQLQLSENISNTKNPRIMWEKNPQNLVCS